MADAGPREHRLLGLHVRRERRARAEAMPLDRRLLARDDRDDARQAARLIRAHSNDARVRVHAADEGDVQHPREHDVAHVPTPARDQSAVFSAEHAGAERAGSVRGVGHSTRAQ
jgi:hypothetical protein